jgi:hypothetical protein
MGYEASFGTRNASFPFPASSVGTLAPTFVTQRSHARMTCPAMDCWQVFYDFAGEKRSPFSSVTPFPHPAHRRSGREVWFARGREAASILPTVVAFRTLMPDASTVLLPRANNVLGLGKGY